MSDADLAPLDLSHLLHAASKKKVGAGLGEVRELTETCGCTTMYCIPIYIYNYIYIIYILNTHTFTHEHVHVYV